MAPIPRCDLRLPNERRSKRSSEVKTTATVRRAVPPEEETATEDEEEEVPEPAHGARRRDTAETLDVDVVPEAAHSAQRKDTAESIEQAAEFSTRLTRDMGEVREHKWAEERERAVASADVCEQLARCRFEPGDDEAKMPPPPPVTCRLELGTPGDTCAQFSLDRAESPSEDPKIDDATRQRARKAEVQDRSMCKTPYRSTIQYESLWGSVNSMATRKKFELEMKKKRKYYERLYERNRIRRTKERRRAAAKRRAMRCRDQSRIPDTKDDIYVNRAFHLRFNYNNRLPYMPSTMDQHFKKFKKPPFKHYHKGSRMGYKHVDEFEKLRPAIDAAAAAAAAAVAAKKPLKSAKPVRQVK